MISRLQVRIPQLDTVRLVQQRLWEPPDCGRQRGWGVAVLQSRPCRSRGIAGRGVRAGLRRACRPLPVFFRGRAARLRESASACHVTCSGGLTPMCSRPRVEGKGKQKGLKRERAMKPKSVQVLSLQAGLRAVPLSRNGNGRHASPIVTTHNKWCCPTIFSLPSTCYRATSASSRKGCSVCDMPPCSLHRPSASPAGVAGAALFRDARLRWAG